jgi:small subunit ribosomal protein S15
MARMHSGKRGQSGSKRPLNAETPSWVRYKAKELELIIVKLAKEGHNATQIGLILRDTYGVPCAKTILGKSILKVLKDKELAGNLPEDLRAVILKRIALQKHLEENNHDMTAKRGLQLTDSKIRRLVKYYKKNNVLPQNWKYDADSLKLAVQ